MAREEKPQFPFRVEILDALNKSETIKEALDKSIDEILKKCDPKKKPPKKKVH